MEIKCFFASLLKASGKEGVRGILLSQRGLVGHLSMGGSLFDWRKRFFFPDLSLVQQRALFCRLKSFSEQTGVIEERKK